MVRAALAESIAIVLLGVVGVRCEGQQHLALLRISANGSHGATVSTPRESQGYLGVDLRDVTDDQLNTLHLREARGAEVTLIDHDAPASKAGLRVHDVVLQLNGQTVEGQEQLRRMLREIPAGHTAAMMISRDGQLQMITAKLANRLDIEKQAWQQRFVVPDPDGAETT